MTRGDTQTRPCAGQSEALCQRSETLYRRLILPRATAGGLQPLRRSLRRGEFRVRRRTRQGNVVTTRTLVYGGVDFTSVSKPSRLRRRASLARPDLPATLTRSLPQPAVDRDGHNIWLARASYVRALGAADPAPFEDSSSRTTTIILGCIVLLVVLLAGRLFVRRRNT